MAQDHVVVNQPVLNDRRCPTIRAEALWWKGACEEGLVYARAAKERQEQVNGLLSLATIEYFSEAPRSLERVAASFQIIRRQ